MFCLSAASVLYLATSHIVWFTEEGLLPKCLIVHCSVENFLIKLQVIKKIQRVQIFCLKVMFSDRSTHPKLNLSAVIFIFSWVLYKYWEKTFYYISKVEIRFSRKSFMHLYLKHTAPALALVVPRQQYPTSWPWKASAYSSSFSKSTNFCTWREQGGQ